MVLLVAILLLVFSFAGKSQAEHARIEVQMAASGVEGVLEVDALAV